METEKWESGERPNDRVLGERWPPGAAEMSQATVSRAVADETHKWTFRPPCSLPSFGHSFMLSDPLAGSDVSRTRIGEKCDISAAHRRRGEQRALSNADVSDRTSDLIGRLGAVSLTRTALHTMHVGL